ncbi:Fe2+-dependent dioxygenase [Marinomonas sp. C2222]|uniref:Fe2+-dependent dioxygenase n=1 Tax=Marinomonas sargassi TaxID=2984494 RepID=A0ABT2YUT6_9GAMM|nr:Fe2+-dependent dioxygenase [Marinomonas sargassi]MCV2403623.1 Fe2+-dependent dioxygenase [Marinomonas sargassi]
MIKILKNVLSLEQMSYINCCLEKGQFVSGKDTAGWAAQSVKNNQQWSSSAEGEAELSAILTQLLASHPEFASCTYAKRVAPFLFSESKDSGGYGNHVDDALMGAESIMRSDLSCTVFLNDPNDYVGGELIMNLGGTSLSYKLQKGSVVIYPSTTLHRVEPVTKGTRRVAVTWIESYIRSTEHREILSDLDSARRNIMKAQGKNAAFDQISKAHANLLRLWSET